MPFVIFLAPFFNENAIRFLRSLVLVDGARFGVISQDPQENLPPEISSRLAAHYRVPDALNETQIAHAVRELSKAHGKPHRLLGAMEQIQEQLAIVREQFEIEGMSIETARNFRDKARMKYLFHKNKIPTARFLGISDPESAWRFAREVGYPVVLKPLAGAASQSTFRVRNDDELSAGLALVAPSPKMPAIIEEFVTGQESSFETMTLNGVSLWHSWTHYAPTPLQTMENPWIQWRVVLPNDQLDPKYDDIRAVNDRALAALGLETGLTHLEWFRRKDGSVAVGEVAARPPGAQITTLISRAHEVNFVKLWGEMMIHGVFAPPTRKFATGGCFLRGQGQGHVRAVRGWEAICQELGDVITDVRLPEAGQPKALSYEGEGFVLVRHAKTEVVEAALERIVSNVSVELG
ncbi:MAG TPA: ATP-grasp domain-containing protein [Thermoflexales bacterium]|nr:ATP-grasp domain-containing protein [Thermoflexales bacterium]HQZ21666.1 ATP-grasp domain-containing protein [Thermoflexales bacterium]HRA00055.1 ATP-grasp domain-containing protein [Thermoflexales bacterium]